MLVTKRFGRSTLLAVQLAVVGCSADMPEGGEHDAQRVSSSAAPSDANLEGDSVVVQSADEGHRNVGQAPEPSHASQQNTPRAPRVMSAGSTESLDAGYPAEQVDGGREQPDNPCPVADDPVDNKIGSQIDLDAPGSHGVTIFVVRGVPEEPYQPCPDEDRACPQRDDYFQHQQDANAAMQRCVELLLEGLGVAFSTEALDNVIRTELNAEQILQVAAHPHVRSILLTEGQSDDWFP